MFVSRGAEAARELVARLTAVVDDLLALDLTSVPGDELLAAFTDLERQKRRLAGVDHAFVAELDARRVFWDLGTRNTAGLLRAVLRISPGEASARVAAATDLGPRQGFSGERLAPIHETLAAAIRTGEVSMDHAAIIRRTIRRLPAAVRAEHDLAVEAFLTEQALIFDPQPLATIARRLAETLDPDGVLTDEDDRAQRRGLTIRQHRDGSSHVEGELTAMCTEALLTVLDTLARPRPAEDGERDPRTAAQRRHDGLHDALLAVLRSGDLPACGGVAATIVLTMTLEQWQTGTGLARTGHGVTVSARQALGLAGDAQILAVVAGSVKPVAAYSSTHRIFTSGQRLAMIARDQGCSFPGCDMPPALCQAHHVTDHAVSGRTTVAGGTLVCGYHHREHPRLGWRAVMRDGIPHWIPPVWVDPEQAPRRNHLHDPVLV